jgi:hypothetical protein
MKLVHLVRLMVLVVLMVSCGRKELPYTDNSKDADLYAQNVRALVLELAQTARNSSEPRVQINVIVKELSQNDRPAGDYRQVFSEMLAVSQKAMDRCPPSGGKGQISKELDELMALARRLPARQP